MSTPIEIFLRFVFWTALYLSAARLGAWVSGSRLRGTSHLAWDGLTGLALLMSVWLSIGLFRFDRPSVSIVYVGCIVAGVALTVRDPIQRWDRPSGVRGSWIAVAGLLFVILLGLFWNRVPVLFYDSLSYQLAQPDLWLLEGRIEPYDWSLHSWFPPGMSVLYGVGLAVGGESWAADANLLFGIALLLVMRDLGTRLWSPTCGNLAAFALLLVPQFLFALAIPAADLAHGTFVFAALAALILVQDASWRRRAALLTGGALLTKYLGLLVPFAAGGLLLLLRSHAGTYSPGRRLRDALAFCVPAMLMLAPWLICNAVYIGNPVAPVFSSWLPTAGIADGGMAAFARDARSGFPATPEWAALPARLFGGEPPGIYPSPAWGFPILFWLFLPLAALKSDARLRRVCLLGSALLAIWFATYRWERFLVPVTCCICLAFAAAVQFAWSRGTLSRVLSVTLVLAALLALPTTLISIARFSGGLGVFLFEESPTQFLARSWPQQALLANPAAQFDTRTDKLLMVGEMRHFRVPIRRAAPSGFNEHPLVTALAQELDAPAVHAALRARGYTHLLFDFNWVERSAAQYPSLRVFAQDPTLLRRYVDTLGVPLVASGPRVLFRIPRNE